MSMVYGERSIRPTESCLSVFYSLPARLNLSGGDGGLVLVKLNNSTDSQMPREKVGKASQGTRLAKGCTETLTCVMTGQCP